MPPRWWGFAVEERVGRRLPVADRPGVPGAVDGVVDEIRQVRGHRAGPVAVAVSVDGSRRTALGRRAGRVEPGGRGLNVRRPSGPHGRVHRRRPREWSAEVEPGRLVRRGRYVTASADRTGVVVRGREGRHLPVGEVDQRIGPGCTGRGLVVGGSCRNGRLGGGAGAGSRAAAGAAAPEGTPVSAVGWRGLKRSLAPVWRLRHAAHFSCPPTSCL